MTRNLIATLALVLAGPAVDAATPEPVRAQARDIFETVIGFQTSEGLGQVPVMVRYLSGRFREAGFAAEDITVIPHGETASMLVRYRGSGKGGRPILLMAHMDVVTARAEDWDRDPFALVEENGYFFGRGTSDIKSEIALLTTTFLRLKAEGFVPSRDLVIAFSGDEETRMDTTRELAAKAREMYDPEFALNGDGGGGVLNNETGAPQIYLVQGAEKSYASFELTARNPGGHSSQPRADNAIYDLVDALKAVQAYRFPVMWNDWTLGSFKAGSAVTPGEVGQAMGRFAANPQDAAAADVLAAQPTLVGRTRTTCVATMLKGGHADNALPQSASATVNCRIFPGHALEEVKATLQRVAGDKVEVRTLDNPFTSDPSPVRKDVLDAVTGAVHAVRPGVPVVPDMAPYATDGSVFRKAGIPTYGVSSLFMKDADEFAHGLNERISVESFYAGLEHWYVMLKTLSSAAPASAQEQHEHRHAHAGAAVDQMQLDQGAKWATDAPLRAGMAAIRAAFDADHPAIHGGTETDARYDALAARIEEHVNAIVANCRLPPAADANLHFVVADLLQGVALMRGKEAGRTRHDGAALVHGSLTAYGKYFEDPDWASE